MANPYVNHVILGSETLIDLRNDDVQRSDVAQGKYFHLKTGERTTGTATGGQTQTKTVTSSLVSQTVNPDAGYALSQVTVNALPVTRTDNVAGGVSVQIG